VVVVLEGRGMVRIGSLKRRSSRSRVSEWRWAFPNAIVNTGRTRLRYYLCATPAADPLTDRENLDPPT